MDKNLKNIKIIKTIFKDDKIIVAENGTYSIELSKKTLRNIEIHKHKVDMILELGAKKTKEWQDNATDKVYLEFTI